tara:strand:- start:2200 stop:2664 length:465 start_codon:yes stop_codon:yes gene_type:complete
VQSSDPLAKIDSLIESIQDFSPEATVLTVVMDNFYDEVKAMNSERISEKSLYVSGKTITPNYHPYTAARKKTYTPDLYETGAFSRSFELVHDNQQSLDGGSIEIFNTDIKYQSGLLSKYEDDGELFGLTENDKALLSEMVKPILINKFAKTIIV